MTFNAIAENKNDPLPLHTSILVKNEENVDLLFKARKRWLDSQNNKKEFLDYKKDFEENFIRLI